MKRREFLASCAALGVVACTRKKAAPPLPPGELSGSGLARGHALRADSSAHFPAAAETRRIPLLIIGGGIAGLSAGWRMQRAGHHDFLIADLEDRVGGNSRYGENAVSRYPLGAHYLPLPGVEARAVRAMLADFGILQGDPHALRPTYDERYLCATPQERLYRNGTWHEGLMPAPADAAELKKIAEFQRRVDQLRHQRDAQGRRAFAIPMEYSSRDPALLALDRMTLGVWLRREGLDCPALRWYLNYASRDDFGTGIDAVSAWAGLHYFCCRDGEAQNASSDIVLTAPEGNGWLVRRLEERLQTHLLCGHVATALRQEKQKVIVDLWQPAQQRSLRIEAQQIIWAAPLFILSHVWQEAPDTVRRAAQNFDYAPWLLANLTLSEQPHTRAGTPLAWDNVLFNGTGLGYIVANHQQIRVHPAATVITYYHALSHPDSQATRRQLLNRPREAWMQDIFNELAIAHPELREITTRFDVFRHGHAMIRPLPGVLWDNLSPRHALSKSLGHIHLAHADLSGMSLFEEANYRGVKAAEQVLGLSGRESSSLV